FAFSMSTSPSIDSENDPTEKRQLRGFDNAHMGPKMGPDKKGGAGLWTRGRGTRSGDQRLAPDWHRTQRHYTARALPTDHANGHFSQHFRTMRDDAQSASTGLNAFQDRCLKPLGHPSDAGRSIAWLRCCPAKLRTDRERCPQRLARGRGGYHET